MAKYTQNPINPKRKIGEPVQRDSKEACQLLWRSDYRWCDDC